MAVLRDTISGQVIGVHDDKIIISDEDGFERTYQPDELSVEQSADYNFDDELTERAIESKLKDVKKEDQRTRENNFIDLHIEELLEDHRYLTNFEIVQTQMEACKGFIRKALNSSKRKIYIIHGKGEGVLKSEVHAFLMKLRSENGIDLEFHDAPYHEFGMGGATEVIFH